MVIIYQKNTLFDFHWTTQWYIPEDKDSNRCENLRSSTAHAMFLIPITSKKFVLPVGTGILLMSCMYCSFLFKYCIRIFCMLFVGRLKYFLFAVCDPWKYFRNHSLELGYMKRNKCEGRHFFL